ncbi:MAG: FAD-dependent oxidoreductase [Kiritimatiellales bacterium]
MPSDTASFPITSVSEEYDVIVCGAGSAGYSAAVAAARLGAKTLIIEEDSVPGGSAVDMGVCSFSDGPPIEGLHAEVCSRLAKADPYFKSEKPNSAFMPFSLVSVIDDLFRESGVTFLGQSRVVGVTRTGSRVRSVRVHSPVGAYGGVKEYVAKVFIDATGNADIAFAAGAPYRFGREAASEFGEKFAPAKADRIVQQMTWMFIADAFRDPDKKPGWCRIGDRKYLIWGAKASCENPLDPEMFSRTTLSLWRNLRDKFTDFEKFGYRPVYISPRPGVRETRRIDGEYMLNYNDLIQGRVFDDAICRACRKIDSWEPEGNPMHIDPNACRIPVYTIPYRSLLPKNIDDLLVAGRCMAVTHVANSSTRIQPICSMAGQAAGTAAALAAQSGVSVRKLSVRSLQEQLRAQGLKI